MSAEYGKNDTIFWWQGNQYHNRFKIFIFVAVDKV